MVKATHQYDITSPPPGNISVRTDILFLAFFYVCLCAFFAFFWVLCVQFFFFCNFCVFHREGCVHFLHFFFSFFAFWVQSA